MSAYNHNFYNNPKLSDVQLLIYLNKESKEPNEVLNITFTNNHFSEAITNDTIYQHKIYLNCTNNQNNNNQTESVEIFCKMIEYFYTKHLPIDLAESELMELLVCADKYNAIELFNNLISFLKSKLTIDNIGMFI